MYTAHCEGGTASPWDKLSLVCLDCTIPCASGERCSGCEVFPRLTSLDFHQSFIRNSASRQFCLCDPDRPFRLHACFFILSALAPHESDLHATLNHSDAPKLLLSPKDQVPPWA